MSLSLERLKELLEYDHEIGVFKWKVDRGPIRAGSTAAKPKPHRYGQIRIDGVLYYAHRLAWFYTHGTWPVNEVDHINGVRNDNRLSNLRDVPHQSNSQNVIKPRKSNKSGYLGINKLGEKWVANIYLHGRTTYLGIFSCKKQAHQAYVEAKRKYHDGNLL